MITIADKHEPCSTKSKLLKSKSGIYIFVARKFMIEELIDRLKEPHNVRIYRELRRKELKKLRKESESTIKDLYEVKCLGEFGDLCEKYIKEKARKDLPQIQFETMSLAHLLDSGKLVLIAGGLGYNEALFELYYVPPEKTRFEGATVISPNCDQLNIKIPLPIDACEKYFEYGNKLAFWHSCPNGFGEPDENDFSYYSRLSEEVKKKEIYFAIYVPTIDRVIWYQIRDKEPSILEKVISGF